MTKIAAIIGGVLLLAGVALAGTAVSLGASGTPTIGSTLPTAAPLTVRHEGRGREAERRGRANERGEDVSHEAHRADRRVRVADDHGHHRRGHDGGGRRGHGSDD